MRSYGLSRPSTTFEEENHLRKLLIGALAVSASRRRRSPPAPLSPRRREVDVKVTVSRRTPAPRRSRRTSKLELRRHDEQAGHDRRVIDLGLPAQGLKLSGKGFAGVHAETLAAEGPTGCPSGSKAGPTGSANALVGAAGPTRARWSSTSRRSSRTPTRSLFYVASEARRGVSVSRRSRGEITSKGRKIAHPHPAGAAPAGPRRRRLAHLARPDVLRQAARSYLVSSVGCKNQKYKFTGSSRSPSAPTAQRCRPGRRSRRSAPARSSAAAHAR